VFLQVRTEVLLELALVARRHVLLVGPHGSGKTALCKHFLQGRGMWWRPLFPGRVVAPCSEQRWW